MSAQGVKVVGRSATRSQPSRRSPAWARATVAIACLVPLGLALVLVFAGSRSASDAGSVPQAGPARLLDGLPAGFAHDPEGAEAMAARFALVTFGVLDGRVSASPMTIASVYATPGYRATLTALLEQTAAERSARASQWSRVAYRRAVLGTRLLSYTPTRATVGTWEIVVAALGHSPVVSDQFTEQWQLEWSAVDWKLSGAPTSEPARMSDGQLAEALNTYGSRGDATPGY